jgi:WhiB family transcriptional regulator, redox-sensing transcriptional regulator
VRGVPSAIENGLFPLESELAWQREAACRGLGTAESQAIFFPTKGESIKEAKAICGGCPVAAECLEFALTNGCIGVWGGTSERERRRLRVERRPRTPEMLGSR